MRTRLRRRGLSWAGESSPLVILATCLAAGMLVGAVTAALAPVGAVAASADPLLEQQWGLHRVGAPDAWPVSRGEDVTIAVIDTGVDPDHEDLSGQVATTTACLGTQGDPSACEGEAIDDDGHGTHVAGIIAAASGNGRGVAGVAPAADLMIVRALRQVCTPLADGTQDCRGVGVTDDIRASIRWAVDHGAHVINLSWADDVVTRVASGSPLAAEIHYAWDRGVIVVVASGNDFDAAMGSGYGDLPMVVVTAITPDGSRAPYANTVGTTPRWAFAAPGGEGTQECPRSDVISTYTGAGSRGGYGCLAGTSMAAPHVAGAIALLRSLGLTPQETLDRLTATADDAGPPGRDAQFGAGIVNAARAVEGIPRRPGGPAAGLVPAHQPRGPTTAAPAARSAPNRPAADSPSPAAAPPSTAAPEPVTPGPASSVPREDGEAVGPSGREGGGGASRLPWALLAAVFVVADGLLALGYRRRTLSR